MTEFQIENKTFVCQLYHRYCSDVTMNSFMKLNFNTLKKDEAGFRVLLSRYTQTFHYNLSLYSHVGTIALFALFLRI